MRLSSCFAALAFFVAASASPALLDPLNAAKPFGAVYFITNSLDENFVVAAQIGEDGILTDVKAISANGAGAEGRPPNLGALFSQGAVEVNQVTGRLAVVNAGSATVQLFDIDPKDPTNITPTGKPVYSGGDFPQSLAWNNAGDKLCVLNGGLKANVKCFIVDKKGALTGTGVGEMTTYNQTANPPMGPPGTASQVIFTADQMGVIAVAKGIPSDLETYPGYLRIWPLSANGTMAETPFQINITQPYGGLTFSLSQAPGRLVYVGSDAANGGIVFDMTAGPGKPEAVLKTIDLPNNKGNCWSVTAPKTGTFFISDLLNDYINEVKLDEYNNATLVRQYPVPGMGPNEAVVADIQGTEYMFMLMETARSLGVWRLDGPGEAVLTQLWEVAIPVEISGVDFETLLVSGMAIYISP